MTLLARLAEQPVPADLPAYDVAVMRREIGLFPEWYAPAVGLAIDLDGWTRAWDQVLTQVAAPTPRVLVLRDYHVDNIILLDRAGCAGSACSTFRTRSPATAPTISSRCCRMRGATCRPRSRPRC